jgi:hypothetical protein
MEVRRRRQNSGESVPQIPGSSPFPIWAFPSATIISDASCDLTVRLSTGQTSPGCKLPQRVTRVVSAPVYCIFSGVFRSLLPYFLLPFLLPFPLPFLLPFLLPFYCLFYYFSHCPFHFLLHFLFNFLHCLFDCHFYVNRAVTPTVHVAMQRDRICIIFLLIEQFFRSSEMIPHDVT